MDANTQKRISLPKGIRGKEKQHAPGEQIYLIRCLKC